MTGRSVFSLRQPVEKRLNWKETWLWVLWISKNHLTLPGNMVMSTLIWIGVGCLV